MKLDKFTGLPIDDEPWIPPYDPNLKWVARKVQDFWDSIDASSRSAGGEATQTKGYPSAARIILTDETTR